MNQSWIKDSNNNNGSHTKRGDYRKYEKDRPQILNQIATCRGYSHAATVTGIPRTTLVNLLKRWDELPPWETADLPPVDTKWNLQEQRSRYYLDNKDAIIADLLQAENLRQVREKWQIPANSLHNLLARWKDDIGPDGMAHINAIKKYREPRGNRIPKLPEFDSRWAPEVQQEWLRAWQIARQK